MKHYIAYTLLLLAPAIGFSQTPQPKKFTLTGSARGLLYGDRIDQETAVPDTVTASRLSSGHTLVDLGMVVRPNDAMEVFGMLRVRNDFGGFWGGGTTFDVRQIYIRGVVSKKIRYQLGDLNYKLTPFTLYNDDEELSFGRTAALQQYMDVVNYDNFYDFENSWRQQGAAVDFGLTFKKYVDGINFNFFTSRVNRTNFGGVSERLFSAISVELLQSKYLSLAANYVNLYDWAGTSRAEVFFRNPVITGLAAFNYGTEKMKVDVRAEVGQSNQFYEGSDEAPELMGGFSDVAVNVLFRPLETYAKVTVRNVEADFRSPGAQSKRINFGAIPAAYQRITNEQVLRPFTLYDLLRETDLYNLQLSSNLQAFDPRYDNITPYGDATPNRSGFIVEAGRNDASERYQMAVRYAGFSELRGQGTLLTKQFTRIEAETRIHVNRFLSDYEKKIIVDAAYRNDQTSRDGEEGVRAVDLNSEVLNLGLEVEFARKLSAVFGFQDLQYGGFDYLPLRAEFDEIVFFNEYEVDGSETMLALGLRYNFSDTDHLSVQWNRYNSTNAVAGIIPNYTIDQLAFLYVMKF